MTDEWRDPATRSPQELEAMTLDELLDSLPLKPWDKDDLDPLVHKVIGLSATIAPADLGDDDHVDDDALERLDFPADGHAAVGPCTCIIHVGNLGFACQNDDGCLTKLSNWFFDRLRKMCL